ncbi:hypothetical protein C8R43DRAFT_886358, partial [Mycena crocata]
GRGWGLDWAGCVDNFMKFEAACGYEESGENVPTTDRPGAVKWWLGRGREWNKRVDVGELGALGMEGTYMDSWWKWWAAMQPGGRLLKADGKQLEGMQLAGGMLTVPTTCDWGALSGLHGRNGFLQVMASLLWWGERVEGDALGTARWSSAVDEVSYVLGEVTEAIKNR